MNPYEAKKVGASLALREDWEGAKYNAMHDVVLAKFSQDEKIREILLSTGEKHLEEGNCHEYS